MNKSVPTVHLYTQLAELAAKGALDAQLYIDLCSALLDLDKYRDSRIELAQLDQYRASVLPMFVDDGTVTTCTSLSGGDNEHKGMPAELTLMRTFSTDQRGFRMARYRHTGLIAPGDQGFDLECIVDKKPDETPS